MPVRFDAIVPVPSAEQLKLQQQRASDRRRRQQRVGDERRRQLLDTAWALWQEAGASGFNMRQLAQRAGYTAGALYAYFPGRDAILSALQQRVIEELGGMVSSVKTPRSDRATRGRREARPPDSAGVVLARSLFIDRSLAWWGCLAADPQRLQLVLHGGHGLPETEGRKLLDDLIAHATSPKYVYKHIWTKDDVIMWDNRCTMHAVEPFDNATIRRVMHRVTLIGEGRPIAA